MFMMMMFQHLYVGNADDDLAFVDDVVFSTNMLMMLLLMSEYLHTDVVDYVLVFTY